MTKSTVLNFRGLDSSSEYITFEFLQELSENKVVLILEADTDSIAELRFENSNDIQAIIDELYGLKILLNERDKAKG
mgnify:CR=1 FL=1